MKKQINAYDFEKISSRMLQKFGTIEKYLEKKYTDILFPIESNLLRANRNHKINNDRAAIEAIHICLLTIDSYLNKITYDLDTFITDTNKPYVTALLMSFDPFTNEALKALAEEKCDIHSEKGLRDYFEPPVKSLLWIEKSIKRWTKNNSNDGYFKFLEQQIGKHVVNNNKIEGVVVKINETLNIDDLMPPDMLSKMDPIKLTTELSSALSAIFNLGYIPAPDEIHELTQAEYASYKRQGGDISKPLYTVIPKNYKYLGPSNEINLMTGDELSKFTRAVLFLQMYAFENGCKSEDREDILKFAAKRLPDYLTKGTKFERSPMKVLEPGEVPLSKEEEVSDFLAHIFNEGSVLNIKVVSKEEDGNTKNISNISVPIKKQRNSNKTT